MTRSAWWQYKVCGNQTSREASIRIRGLTCGLLGLLLLLGAFAAPVPSHAAAGTAMISVVVNDDDPQTIDLALFDPDVKSIRDYPYQSPTDPQGTTKVASGLSVTRLIQLAGVDPATVTQVDVTNPASGLPVVLTPEEVHRPSSFLDQLPAVFLDKTEAAFLRPLRAEDDMNADDAFTAPVGQALQVHIDAPPPLEISARVNRTTTTVGKSVTFFVNATGAPGEVLTARWNFGDGVKATVPLGATPHVYRHARIHRGITVTVRGDQGSAGTATIAKITVKQRPVPDQPPADGSGDNQGGAGDGQGGVAGSTTGGGQSYDDYYDNTPSYDDYGTPSYNNGAPTTPSTAPTPEQADPGQTVTGTVLGTTDQRASAVPVAGNDDDSSTQSYSRLGAAAIGVALLTLGALREFRALRRNDPAPVEEEAAPEQETADVEAKHEA